MFFANTSNMHWIRLKAGMKQNKAGMTQKNLSDQANASALVPANFTVPDQYN
jgi:hypothetical protein